MVMVNPVSSVVRQSDRPESGYSCCLRRKSNSVYESVLNWTISPQKYEHSFQFNREQQFPSQLSCRRSYEPPFTTSCLSFACNHAVSRFNKVFNL